MRGEQCPNCKHFIDSGKTYICDAYPKGIPYEIASGQHDHTKHYKGDGGIMFELVKK